MGTMLPDDSDAFRGHFIDAVVDLLRTTLSGVELGRYPLLTLDRTRSSPPASDSLGGCLGLQDYPE